MVAICPTCRRPHSYQRLGVFFSPLKAQLIDKVKAAGPDGISAPELLADLYGDQPRTVALVRNHIAQINDLLEATDWRIRCEGRGGSARWRLVREYDSDDDITKSFEVAYETVRARKAAGGKGWEPK